MSRRQLYVESPADFFNHSRAMETQDGRFSNSEGKNRC